MKHSTCFFMNDSMTGISAKLCTAVIKVLLKFCKFLEYFAVFETKNSKH